MRIVVMKLVNIVFMSQVMTAVDFVIKKTF